MNSPIDVLILDDEMSVCESLAIVLRPKRVHYETGVKACLAFLKSEAKPKLLIIDYKIGNDDGIEFYTQTILKEIGPIPAVLISGYVGQKDRPDLDTPWHRHFLRAIQKPFDVFALRSEIFQLLDNL